MAVTAAKSNAKRLREQDGGTLDLHRQSLRQHGLLHDRSSVGKSMAEMNAVQSRSDAHEQGLRAESRRQKDEAKAKELEEWERKRKETNGLWNWIRRK